MFICQLEFVQDYTLSYSNTLMQATFIREQYPDLFNKKRRKSPQRLPPADRPWRPFVPVSFLPVIPG